MAAPKKVDYERIEPGWRAGIKSPSQLAAEYTEETGVSVSHAAIIKHFKRLGVPRDLKAKVISKADAMVMQAMVTGKVTAATTLRDSELITRGALDVAQVRLSHRVDITRMRRLVLDLLAELECQTGNLELFERLGEMLRSDDERSQDKRNDLYQRVISTAGRIDGLKKLADAMKVLIGLEREAYGLDPCAQGQPDAERAKKDLFTDAELLARARRIVGSRACGPAAADPAGG